MHCMEEPVATYITISKRYFIPRDITTTLNKLYITIPVPKPFMGNINITTRNRIKIRISIRLIVNKNSSSIELFIN